MAARGLPRRGSEQGGPPAPVPDRTRFRGRVPEGAARDDGVRVLVRVVWLAQHAVLCYPPGAGGGAAQPAHPGAAPRCGVAPGVLLPDDRGSWRRIVAYVTLRRQPTCSPYAPLAAPRPAPSCPACSWPSRSPGSAACPCRRRPLPGVARARSALRGPGIRHAGARVRARRRARGPASRRGRPGVRPIRPRPHRRDMGRAAAAGKPEAVFPLPAAPAALSSEVAEDLGRVFRYRVPEGSPSRTLWRSLGGPRRGLRRARLPRAARTRAERPGLCRAVGARGHRRPGGLGRHHRLRGGRDRRGGFGHRPRPRGPRHSALDEPR